MIRQSRSFRWVVLSSIGLMMAIELIRSVESINPVLDLNSTFPYLINKTDGRVIEPRDYMDFENVYSPNETYRSETNAPKRLYHLLKAFDFANYFQTDHWHYSDAGDLLQSALPVANASLCALQLDWLENKLNKSPSSLFEAGEQSANLMSMVDAFGKLEAENYQGHNQWLGSYEQCRRVSIDLGRPDADSCRGCGAQPLRARYCIGKARDIDWPEDDHYVPRISYKIGLCLPESCETRSIGAHRDQLERLMLFNMPEYMKPRLRLVDLYCLPDPRSPVRSVSLAGRVFLSVLAIWLTSVAVSTVVYSCHKRHQRDLSSIFRRARQVPSEEVATKLPDQPDGCQAKSLLKNGTHMLMSKAQEGRLAIGKMCLDVPASGAPADSACCQLEGSSSSLPSCSSSRMTHSDDHYPHPGPASLGMRIAKSLSFKENLRDFLVPPEMLRDSNSVKKLRINLNALDSIKCLCCVLVIFGHIVFIHMQHLRNIVLAIELSHEVYPRILIAFFNFVDTFFIISGMLTAYFIFKRFDKNSFASPAIWIQVIIMRLIRLSPVYVLALWFIKTLSVHLGEGPIWDYGTDKNSIRGLCISDPWWKSILYLGNVNSMQPVCILPAWSIIVDSQYSLVTPPVLFLLLRHRKLGYLLLVLAALVSTLKMSLQLANQTAVKTSDMAKIRLHVYPLISRFAAEFYNSAWNRVGPVAIGIMGGHLLYLYDIKAIRRWPWYMRGLAFKFVLFMHLFIFILPTIGRFMDDPESRSETDVTIFVLSNATIKPVWSLINTIFLLRLITDLRLSSLIARLMSHNIWHCMGKLCFASYLIHYEIIMILLKSKPEGFLFPSWSNVLREFSYVFIISTVISYFIYVLYESPINKLCTVLISGSRRQPSSDANKVPDQQCCCGAQSSKPNPVFGQTPDKLREKRL